MSRAFVKETEDVEDLPDRPISDLPNDVTADGLRQIEQGDGTTAPVTVGGLSARKTVQTSAPAEHMYFQVDDAVAFDGAFIACLQFQYFDEGGPSTGPLALVTSSPAESVARRVIR